MEKNDKLAAAALLTAIVAFSSLVVLDQRSKDSDPLREKRHLVREWPSEDGGKVFAYLEPVDGGEQLVEAPPQCVIPVCDATEKPVDCLRSGKWRGCNVMPKEEASGSECEPASCWIYFGEENGK